MSCQRILILGGYGNFGKRITETLADTADITLIIAGRRSAPAQQLQAQLQSTARACLETATLDLHAADFETRLAALKPDLVIHTGGPFQGQDYRVPRACIAAGCHYIDLADDRRFVCDISQLDAQARAAGVLLVSGASSVPGLSSCVIAHYADQFSRLSLRRLYFDATIGRRPLANVDIPDLELLPAAYPTVRSVRFQAGLELGLLHYGMWLMAGLARIGLVRDWSRWSKPIVRASEWFIRWGTDTGGMQINLRGLDQQQQPLHLKWVLGATEGIGPYIPTLSALILARRLVSGELGERGAMPCMNLFPLSAFEQEAQGLAIYHQLETHRG